MSARHAALTALATLLVVPACDEQKSVSVGSGDSGAGDSGAGDSGAGDSGAGDSGTGDSGTGDSGSDSGGDSGRDSGGATPSLRVDPLAVDWGTGDVGGVFATRVTLSNEGSTPLTILAVELLGAATLDPGAFTSSDVVLAPGASGALTVGWAPVDAGCVDASLVIRSDDAVTPFWVVPVAGCAEAPEGARTVAVELTADDAWEAWLDGAELVGTASTTWSTTDTFERTLAPGDHVLAIHGSDSLGTISGVLAAVTVDGTLVAATGDGAWLVSTTEEAGWTTPTYDDAAWSVAPACGNDSPWGGQPSGLRAAGAAWIWWTLDCTALGEGWFRRGFTVE